MKILVFGAGAVGGYLGACLANAGHEVTLVTRRTSADAIERHGLTLIQDGKQTVTRPLVMPAMRQAFLQGEAYELILVTMKSYDAQAALYELVAFCPTIPTVITMQNGIGIEETFALELGADQVVAGSLTTPLSHETTHNIVVERHDRGLGLAPVMPGAKIGRWVKLFQAAGIETVGYKDYRAMKWSKALLNMVGNATSAILNRHPRVIYNYDPTFEIEMTMLKETLAVMKAKNISVVDLPGAQARRLALAARRLPKALVKPILSGIVSSGRGNKMPSFHIDLMAGREQNEVSYHNAVVARQGYDLGINVPINMALSDILLKIALKEIDYQAFNGRPKRLVSEVELYKEGKIASFLLDEELIEEEGSGIKE
ncbi:MAG: 2-dehydropantoate 2-reductase [Chloroflexota bacterium]|jgi:2-dehydropantoate 2-reductase